MSQLSVEHLDGRLSGEMDVAVAANAESHFLAIALGTAAPTLVIDCAGLTFIDSSGVRMLERVAERSGKRLVLTGIPLASRRVFDLLEVSALFGIEAP